MNPIRDHLQAMTRRHFFRTGALGLGAAALSSLGARAAKATGGIPGFAAAAWADTSVGAKQAAAVVTAASAFFIWFFLSRLERLAERLRNMHANCCDARNASRWCDFHG